MGDTLLSIVSSPHIRQADDRRQRLPPSKADPSGIVQPKCKWTFLESRNNNERTSYA
jgi:hypothetical protein